MKEHEEWFELSAYMDGALGAEQRSGLESHISECAHCRAELETLRQAKQKLAAAPRRAFPADLIQALERNWAEKPSRIRVWPGLLWQGSQRWLPAGAVAAAALIMGLWLGFHKTEDEVPVEILAAAHSRYSAEGLIPGDMVASNFSSELEQVQRNDN